MWKSGEREEGGGGGERAGESAALFLFPPSPAASVLRGDPGHSDTRAPRQVVHKLVG